MKRDDCTRAILDAAFRVHTRLGPGLLEKTYEYCLCYELNEAGLFVEQQKAMPLVYEGHKLEMGYRTDIVVDSNVIVEIKSIESFNEVHIAQLLTYLKLSGLKIGLLLNFNVAHLRNGIKRVVL
jgi:GxxExxY protein